MSAIEEVNSCFLPPPKLPVTYVFCIVVIQSRHDGHQRKVGVRFESLPSNSSGEEARGFFVDASHLRHEVEQTEPLERSYMYVY